MNCTACGNTGLVPMEKGPAGATYTVLARCKCQIDVVTISRDEYEALTAAAVWVLSNCAADCPLVATLRAAGIRLP